MEDNEEESGDEREERDIDEKVEGREMKGKEENFRTARKESGNEGK